MKRTTIIGIVLLLAIFAGLALWYFFLEQREDAIATVSEGRLLDETAPEFEGSVGSTFNNIIVGFRGNAPVTSGAANSGVSSAPSFGFGSALRDLAAEIGLGGEKEVATVAPALPQLYHVHMAPISGFGFIQNGTTTVLRFMERSTGSIFDVDPETGVLTRVTQTLIPKVYEASFNARGDVIGVTIEGYERVTFTALVEATTTPGALVSLTPTSLGAAIFEASPGPKTKDLLTLVRDGGGMSLVSSQWDGTKPTILFTSFLANWRAWWLPNHFIIAERPATGVAGRAYAITKGSPTLLIGPLNGLSLLPHASSSAILYSTDSGSLTLFVRATDTAVPITIPLRTVAEKCTWGPLTKKNDPLVGYCATPRTTLGDRFTDEWYRGTLHTSDIWWRFDASSGTVEALLDPASFGVSLDVVRPMTDQSGAYLAFMDNTDASLWLLRIAE